MGCTPSPPPCAGPRPSKDAHQLVLDTHAPTSLAPLPYANIFPLQSAPPPRPNTDPRSNRPPLTSSPLPVVSSTLNKEAWSFYLQDYPDRDFVDTISHIIQHGANLGFSGDRNHLQTCSNLQSAPDFPTTIEADISAIGRIRGPSTAPPFSNFRCSPLGSVTKKRTSKRRCIHHLSWPHGISVNDGIPDEEATIVYDTFNHAARDLADSGQGSLMVKLDLERAFRHIPVRPADWHLLGFTWAQKLYHDVVLGFGVCSAPYIFNLFAEGLHWILQRHIPAKIRHYLDDFLQIFAPSSIRKSGGCWECITKAL